MRSLCSAAIILVLSVTPVRAVDQGHVTTHNTATHASAPSHSSGTQHKTAHTTSASKHTSTTATTTGKTPPTSPIAAKIESHPKLAAKLSAMLPKNTTLDQAAMGFKNQGQFIAALHVSKNLGIPFADLKAQMTGIPAGTTGTSTTGTTTTTKKSLGQAIQALRPSADAETESHHAESEADDDVKSTTTTTTTTNAPSKNKKH